MLPDLEVLVVSYLRDRAAVTAITDRIGTRTPSTLSDPWARVTQLGDTPDANSPALHTSSGYLQIDCYGSDDINEQRAEASLLARTIREELHAMPSDLTLTAVVSRVTFGSLARIPDDDLEPARERFILTCSVYSHP